VAPFHTRPRIRTLAMALAWLAALLLGLGLPSRLVVCARPCCAGHVKLTRNCEHLPGPALAIVDDGRGAGTAAPTCCGHHGHHERRAAQPSDGGDPHASSAGCEGCVHVALGVDLATPPPADHPLDAVAVARDDGFGAATWHANEPSTVVHPPATGPPRCDRRTRLLATTVLRL